jgi:hypothetical protein
MSFIPLFGKQRLYENILAFRTLSTVIRTWVERGREGPTDQEDFAEINAYVQANRQVIDSQEPMASAEMLAGQFPRICAVEVMNGSKTNGCLLYPRWP